MPSLLILEFPDLGTTASSSHEGPLHVLLLLLKFALSALKRLLVDWRDYVGLYMISLNHWMLENYDSIPFAYAYY